VTPSEHAHPDDPTGLAIDFHATVVRHQRMITRDDKITLVAYRGAACVVPTNPIKPIQLIDGAAFIFPWMICWANFVVVTAFALWRAPADPH
jgi:hypothetical protein